jgi:membrane protease YdiL (CAAX protease family)
MDGQYQLTLAYCVRPTMISVHGVLLEATGVTIAGSLLLRLALTADPALRWLAPATWLYLPLVPLLLQRLPLAPHGYSVRQWCQGVGRPLLVGLGTLSMFAVLVGGWRLLVDRQPPLPQNVLSLKIALAQLALVAIPEELFFRGYAQERLRFWASQCGLPQRPVAILLSAMLFALAHVVVLPGWWRAAVFFPGCVMGWLRTYSRGLLAPTLFHWLANLLALALHL